MTGDKKRRQDTSPNGVAFGASFNSSGKRQRDLQAHIVVMPGGIMLVDTALDFAPGRPISGPIYCDNGR